MELITNNNGIAILDWYDHFDLLYLPNQLQLWALSPLSSVGSVGKAFSFSAVSTYQPYVGWNTHSSLSCPTPIGPYLDGQPQDLTVLSILTSIDPTTCLRKGRYGTLPMNLTLYPLPSLVTKLFTRRNTQHLLLALDHLLNQALMLKCRMS